MIVQQDIRNLTVEELKNYLTSIGDQPFRASQIFEWLYGKGVGSFDEMTNLSAGLKSRLKKDFEIRGPGLVRQDVASDETTKFLFDMADHEKVETVLIPTERRTTACISTQAGCKFGCRFCASGIGGWSRNLSCAEILSQVLYVKKASVKRPLSHIVFMGVGEPCATVKSNRWLNI